LNVKHSPSWPLALVLVRIEESVGLNSPIFTQPRTTGMEANTKTVLFILNGGKYANLLYPVEHFAIPCTVAPPEWVAIPSSRGSSLPRDRTLTSFALTGRFFTTSTT